MNYDIIPPVTVQEQTAKELLEAFKLKSEMQEWRISKDL